ncbi:unnamed protein product [Oikopleura dioica]|uniref:Uncharacterized protein n=1 Tax=Oikopleura dioica TaxID=34765 RepID=E4WTZ9_OIKDI|nr:unnamed protein product [Oikopleura dioica]
MYIPEDKNRIFTDEEVEFIMSPILKEEDSKLLEDEKGYMTVKRGPIGRAIKNFWTFFGIFSYLLIAGLITAFFVWCYWVRKKAHEKRRKMENEWTVDSEGAYETIASEDEDSDESELTGIWGEDEPDIEGGIGNPPILLEVSLLAEETMAMMLAEKMTTTMEMAKTLVAAEVLSE